MTNTKLNVKTHPADTELADFLDDALSRNERHKIEEHIASCDECLGKIISAHESVDLFKRQGGSRSGKANFMKKINWYLVLAIISFTLSFVFARYFIQLLVATLLLGIKWIVDAKTTKMLVTIYDAWKTGGEKEASRIFKRLDQSAIRKRPKL
ncbi:MAG: zf-HC2 domain-containing protein [Candidatus Omnitrophota bacterium]